MGKEGKPLAIIGKCQINASETEKYIAENMAEWIKVCDVNYRENKNKALCECIRTIWSSLYSWAWNEESRKREAAANLANKLKKVDMLSREVEQSFDVYYKDDALCHIGIGTYNVVLPNNDLLFENFHLFPDYGATPINKLRVLTKSSAKNNCSLVPFSDKENLSINDVNDLLESKREEVKKLLNEIEDTKECKHGELAELKKEIEAKKAELETKMEEQMAILNAKKSEMEKSVRDMKTSIFMLESEIYSIQCFLGETVEFLKIRAGQNASPSHPVLMLQKIRYLDEELGRLASIYDFSPPEDTELFETLLRHSDLALETFCPSTKCISLVRASKTGTTMVPHEKFQGILSNYELIHGKKIGILIRDNDNLYFGWTDESKINIADDFFFVPGVKDVASETDVRKENSFYSPRIEPTEESIWKEKMNTAKEFASRYFLFSILQGAIEKEEPLLKFDNPPNMYGPSNMVIYSSTDNWIEDNRYGKFTDIVKKCNSVLQKGDDIVTMLSLFPTNGRHSSQTGYLRNDRGRGWTDRTHDCQVENCTIYPINHIDTDIEWRDYYKKVDGTVYYQNASPNTEIVYQKENGDTFIKREEKHFYSYYVSVVKHGSCYGTTANYRVEKDEFINLTYMNSNWLKYAINSKNLAGWMVGGQNVSYAYAIKYLKTAMDYIIAREKNEIDILSEYIPNIGQDSEWNVTLSNWKLENNVRNITEFQAKRFVKYYNKTKK